MAWLQKYPSGDYHISFRFGGKKFKRSLRTKNKKRALTRQARLEDNIDLVKRGRLIIPNDADVATYLLSDVVWQTRWI